MLAVRGVQIPKPFYTNPTQAKYLVFYHSFSMD